MSLKDAASESTKVVVITPKTVDGVVTSISKSSTEVNIGGIHNIHWSTETLVEKVERFPGVQRFPRYPMRFPRLKP